MGCLPAPEERLTSAGLTELSLLALWALVPEQRWYWLWVLALVHWGHLQFNPFDSCAASVGMKGKDKGVRDSHSGRRSLLCNRFGVWEEGTMSSPFSVGTRLVAATFIFRDILVKEKHSTIIYPVGQERQDHRKGAQETQECCVLC